MTTPTLITQHVRLRPFTPDDARPYTASWEKLGMTFIEQTNYFSMDCFRYLMTDSDWTQNIR